MRDRMECESQISDRRESLSRYRGNLSCIQVRILRILFFLEHFRALARTRTCK